MTDRFELLTLADSITSNDDLDKETAFDYVDKLYNNIDKLSIGDRECVSSACKKVIEWLSKQENEELEAQDWFSIVKKLCTTEKDEEVLDMELQADISHEVHRSNVHLLVDSNVVLRLIEMCFSEKEPEYKDDSGDFKGWYGRISLLCSFLDCGWDRLTIEQANALRYAASINLRIIPAISVESEKIFIRSILRIINRIVHLVAGYEGHEEFSKNFLALYRDVIAKTPDCRDEEHVVTSLIMNLDGLAGSESSEETMDLLWEMLMKMCARLRDDDVEGTKEKKNQSPNFDFHKSLDQWLSTFIQSTIQDSLEEKTFRREEVCNWIISTLTVSAHKIQPTFEDFETVLRTSLSTSGDHSPSLCSSLSRFYTRLMQDNIYTLDQQNRLIDTIFELWNPTNESSALILLKKIFEGDSTHSLFVRTANRIIEEDAHSEKKLYLVLEDCVAHMESRVKKELARKVVEEINEMTKEEATEERLVNCLRHLIILMERKVIDGGAQESQRIIHGASDLSQFNELLNTKEYTRMLNLSMEALFGSDMKKDASDAPFLPPVNTEYVKRIIDGEKLLSYHHAHYFLLHTFLSKSKEYMDYLIAINGGRQIEPLLTELCSQSIMEKMIQSMLKIMLSTREMYPLQLSGRYNSSLGYILSSMADGTLSQLSPYSLKLITSAITSVELRFALCEFANNTSDREAVRSRMYKLIQIGKCSLLTEEERCRLLDGVKKNVQKAIFAIMFAYNDSSTAHDALKIQQKLIAILRYHMGTKGLSQSTVSFMDLYLPEFRLANSSHSFEGLLIHLMGALCDSSTVKYPMESGSNHFDKKPLSPYITTPLMDRFTRLLLSLFSSSESKFLPHVDWNIVSKKKIASWLDTVGDLSGGNATSLPLIVFLAKIIHGENMREETRSLIMDYMAKKGPSFVLRVLRSSPCKPVFFHALTPLIEYLRSKNELSSEVDQMLVECVPLLFSDPVTEMVQFFPVHMQSTDRYAQTQLHWRSIVFPLVEDETQKDVIDPIFASFNLLARLSTFKRLIFTMMETLEERLQQWLVDLDDDIMVLRGVTVTHPPNTQVVWKVQLISQAFAYISCVADEVRKREEKEEKEKESESDEGEQEEKLLLLDGIEAEEELVKCTFVNTCKEFTKQHWYNCYTCNMVDSEGVCTVCALNCHKGHDLSYSKLGSFFCDCGAKMCTAMNGAKNKPANRRIKRMRRAKREEKWTPLVNVPLDVTREEVEKYLKMSQKVLSTHSKSLNDLIEGIEKAYEGKFLIDSRRKRAMMSMEKPVFKYEECVMVAKTIANEGLEQLDRTSESVERAMSKECSATIRLRDGSALLLHVNEQSTHLSLVYIGVPAAGGELGDTRVERENLPFPPRRISVKDEFIAITGVDEIAFLRVSLSSGDLIHKEVIRIKDASSTNPIMKAVWSVEGEEKESLTLAVATTSFVRVYNVLKDSENHELELVLPVGSVIDLTFVKKEGADFIWILVLSSQNYLYYHQLGGPGPEMFDDSRSIYLTNTLPLPVDTSAASLHFSQVTRMLYVSFQRALYCAHVKDGDVMNIVEGVFHKLDGSDLGSVESFVGWTESEGLVAALAHPPNYNKVIFIYPTLNEMLIQVASLPQNAHSISLAPSSSFDSVMGLVLLSSYRRPAMLFTSNWLSQPDLWMEHRSMKMDKIAMVEEEDGLQSSHEETVTLFETCSEVKEVEYRSRELEEFYSSGDLTARLKIPEAWPITCLNKDEVNITIRVSKRHFEVKGLRLEVEGANGPKSVSYNGKKIELKRRKTSVYDIALAPNETINSERDLTIRLECPQSGPTIILSLRAFGDSREDLYARCLTFPSLSLPYQCVLHSLKMIHELLEYDLPLPTHVASSENDGESREWIVKSCLLVVSPRSCRPALSEMAKKLLKRYLRGEKTKYYEMKDKAVIESFAKYGKSCNHIPGPVLTSYLSALRQMIKKRYENVVKYAEQFFGDVVNMCLLLHREMECMDGEESTQALLVSAYLQLTCSLLSNNHAMSTQVMAQLIGVLTDHKTRKLWRRLREELRRTVRESLDGSKSCEWTEKMIGVMTHSIVDEIKINPIPVWWKGALERDEKIDLPFQRALMGMNSLVEACTAVLGEFSREKTGKILAGVVDQMDTISVMREEDDVRVKNVRIGGVIALIVGVCKGLEKEVEEMRETAEEKDDRKTIVKKDKEGRWRVVCAKEEEMSEIFNSIVLPLLEDEKRREKLLTCNFRLMEESLKFISCWKQIQRLSFDRGWIALGSTTTGGMSTSECLMEYYTRVGRWSLRLPLLFLLPDPPIFRLAEDRKKIICEMVLVEERLSLRREAQQLLFYASGCDEKKTTETKNEYVMMRNLDILKLEYLPKLSYSHEDSTAIIEIIGRVRDIAGETSDCWRRVCEANLRWILLLTSKVSEPVGVTMLELVQTALRIRKEDDVKDSRSSQPPLSPLQFSIADTLLECAQSRNVLKVLIVKYLLGREEARRWLMHAVCRSLMQLARRKNQIELANMLFYEVLPMGRRLGERGAQLGDLCSAYLPTLLPSATLHSMATEELSNLDALLTKLERSEQKGAADWMVQAGMGWRDALYLSPDPCVQCLRPNETMEVFKLSAIKGEAKYTTNALMYKLNGHYEICKVIIKLADVKKSRSIRRVTLFCTWKAIESAVDLKTHREMWKEVASAQVSSSDTEVTLTVAIPIVTNGLVIEMSEVNDTRGSSEVHCPRCSSLVRPTPGVCDNCGENVYQCVKCRAINYDEKEPFLCSTCGHCKYARIDVSVVGRGQPMMVISADKDKPMAWRASKSMNKLQWEMDTNRSQLRVNSLLAQSLTIGHSSIPTASFPVEARVVMDPTFPHIAQIGPNDPRSLALNECMKRIREASEALRSQSLQLLSIRDAMRKMDQVYNASTSLQFYNSGDGGCIGCLVSSIIHSISLLRSLSAHSNISAAILLHSDLIYNRLVKASGSIDTLRDELESLMIRLCESEEGVDRLCEVVRDQRIPASALARSLLTIKRVRWSERLDCLLQCAMEREEDDEAQIALIHVLLDSMREAKTVLKMMEERKKTRRFMGEKGPSGSSEKKEKKEESWGIIDAILNSNKKVEVDDIEKERSKCKDVDKLLWRLVFSRSIFVRSLAGRLIRAMMSVPGQAGAVISICLLGLSHARLNEDSSRCDQFFLAFNCLIERGQIKLRLFQANFHLHLMGVILSESHRLSCWERGDQSVSHFSGGFVFHCTNLLSNVLSSPLFVASSRESLLVPLLHSCILLRRVTIKRNRAIARALFQLENLLRRCTAQEGLSLLTAAVACLSQVKDEKSRADVVGVILETLDPREKQSDEFLIQVEKDAAQEDFLQGRMQQNPYKSGDASMGPLMRDIKDKICRESELIAFLDDDNGMELLVNGKIISLSLPVKLVYDAVWKPFHPGEPMVIVYRMRGLMGDAVEPFVENIDDKTEGESIGEEELRLLKAFLACGGVTTTLSLLSNCSLSPNGCLLLVQLRKLLVHLLRVDSIKRELINQGGVSVLLGLVKRVRTQGLSSDESMAAAEIDLLRMMNSLVSDGNHHPILRGMSAEECEWLLSLLEEEEGGTDKRDRPHSELVLQVTKILGNGVLGSDVSEQILVTKLKEGLNWEDLLNEKSDCEHGSGRRRRQNVMDDAERRADSFTLVVDGILATEKGTALKQKLIDAGVIDEAVKALLYMHPPLYGTVESPEWKTYLARPALKLVLRLLKGMAKGDERSQVEIAKKALPMLHRLEQVSSAEHLGTLAENVMEALSQNKEVATLIDDVRDETRKKKRQMAMAMREKQLSKLGMRMGRGGEVTVSSRAIVNEPDLGEASDPLTSCCICRESILTGSRVAATYAFAMPYVHRTQDTLPTHCSLSLSVMVHVDCHHNAIRRSNGGRNTDEWTKAALHNSGARCNMVVPIPVAEPSTSDWNSAVSRMEGDLEGVIAGGGPITRHRVFLDMCNLIRKFVLNRSFSENAGGGGRESNIQYLGVLHLLALHLPEGELPCSMPSERLNSFLLTSLTVTDWNGERMDVLRAFLRDISLGEARGVARESLLRESLLQWTFVDLYFNRVIPVDGEDRFKWLQSHFGETLKKTSELVKYFDSTLLPVKKNEDLAKIIGVDMDDALSLSTATTPT